jgi:hypothetical protein
MTIGSVIIERRYRGPPNSANGGYACGRVARFIDGTAEVTLHVPPPLDRQMQITATDTGVALHDGETLVASARPTEITNKPISPPSFTDAIAAATRTFPEDSHTLPGCFVCGPQRAQGDGLRIHPGPLDADDVTWSGILAAPWVPGQDLADRMGVVMPEFVWAALDCPTAYAASSATGMPTILLGRQTVFIERCPAAGQRCIIATQLRGVAGRKYYADATLFCEEGILIAHCNATWIKVSSAVQRGEAGN